MDSRISDETQGLYEVERRLRRRLKLKSVHKRSTAQKHRGVFEA